jgi:hypothetical protein
MATSNRKVTKQSVAQLFRLLGECELSWATVIWLMCDYYHTIASEARRAIGEAIDAELIIHDRGYLYLPKSARK